MVDDDRLLRTEQGSVTSHVAVPNLSSTGIPLSSCKPNLSKALIFGMEHIAMRKMEILN